MCGKYIKQGIDAPRRFKLLIIFLRLHAVLKFYDTAHHEEITPGPDWNDQCFGRQSVQITGYFRQQRPIGIDPYPVKPHEQGYLSSLNVNASSINVSSHEIFGCRTERKQHGNRLRKLLHDGSEVHLTMVQLPALNTPQFEIGRAKVDRHPQPVPPIYQPEVAANAIVWASEHDRREIYVGGPTVKTIWGNKLLPSVLDRYLARTGYDAQLTDEVIGSGRDGNLFAPVPGNHGTHGRFEDARRHSVQLALAKRRMAIAGAGALAIAAGAITASRILR